LIQKRAAARSQLIIASDPNEQFVPQLRTQAVQSAAHGGLAEVNALCGLGHIALVQKSFQGNQEIQVDVSELHRTHMFHSNNAWCDYIPRILQCIKEKCPCKINPSPWLLAPIKESVFRS